LSADVVVEEKVDGANVGISIDEAGQPRAQNRGGYLGPGAHPQFQPLWSWIAERREALTRALGERLILFGEWCFAVHSFRYTRLPGYFLGFDVYDRGAQRFWNTQRRDALLEELRAARVPDVGRGRFSLGQIIGLLGESKLTTGPMEGVYVRRDAGAFL